MNINYKTNITVLPGIVPNLCVCVCVIFIVYFKGPLRKEQQPHVNLARYEIPNSSPVSLAIRLRLQGVREAGLCT